MWKEIPGFPGYEAHPNGLVRSVDRIMLQKTRAGIEAPRLFRGRILKPKLHRRNGYLVLGIGRGATRSVHRLIALSFHGQPPEPNSQVNHKNGIKTDNRAENLEWVSPRENIRHAIGMGRFARWTTILSIKSSGTGNPKAKLTPSMVREIRESLNAGIIQEVIAERYGVSVPTVSSIKLRRTWKHVD